MLTREWASKSCKSCLFANILKNECRVDGPQVYVLADSRSGKGTAYGFFPPMVGPCSRWEAKSEEAEA